MTAHDPALVERVADKVSEMVYSNTRMTRGDAEDLAWDLARAALDAILTTHAVVELARGNADWRSVDWQPVGGWDLAAYKGQIHIDEASNEPLSPDEARSLAAALLAAVAEADR